jgi:hypothetical protein
MWALRRGSVLEKAFKLREEKMIIDFHSHMGDPWYFYWKKNVDVEDHLVSIGHHRQF